MSNKTNDLTVRDLIRLIAFYKAMHPTIQPHDLLKIGGFKIAGLEATESVKSRHLRRGDHRLAWHKVFGGVCTCSKWQSGQDWERDKIVAQHGMHARLAKASLPPSAGILVSGVTPSHSALAGHDNL